MTVRRVGRYEILREIGRGGMSVVHLARHVDLGREVALKELSAFHAASPGAAARFVRESRLAGALAHPNVVTVHDFFEDGGTPFIAMEYLPFGSLRPFVGRLSLAQVAGVLDAVLAGLERAAEVGIVHRDLKPENLLLTAEGTVKIADFGIAKARTRAGEAFTTAPGTTVGTPEYMAPEQALGGDVGPWTDLYALGVIAYELLTGSVPFRARGDEEPLALLLRHVNEPPPPLRARMPATDPGLARWVERLLSKEPERRPGHARAAREELDELALRLVGARWRRSAALPVEAVARPAGDAPTAAPLLPAPDARRRRARRRVALAVAAAAAAAGGAWLGAARTVPGERDTTASRVVGGDAVSLRVPASWSPVRPALPGATSGVAARGPGGERVEAVVTDGGGPLLLPAALQEGAGRPRHVRLGPLDALRYQSGPAVLWAVPLRQDVLVVRCADGRATCLAAAASARPSTAAVAIGPTAAYAARLRSALSPLAARARAAASARTAEGRRASARALARSAAVAWQRLGRSAPGAWEAAAHARLRAALGALEAGARQLARSAGSARRARLRAAEARLEVGLRAVAGARGALRELGYR